jgi:hypothetical protein
MKSRCVPASILLIPLLSVQLLAMKSKQETFPESCDVVWKASITVAKTKQYRIISASKDEQILSVAVGGVWGGERIISLSLAPDGAQRCTATVQSRFSGLAHSDGPDLLARVHVEIVAGSMDRDSEAFRKYKSCVEWSSSSKLAKCDAKLRGEIASLKDQPQTR